MLLATRVKKHIYNSVGWSDTTPEYSESAWRVNLVNYYVSVTRRNFLNHFSVLVQPFSLLNIVLLKRRHSDVSNSDCFHSRFVKVPDSASISMQINESKKYFSYL